MRVLQNLWVGGCRKGRMFTPALIAGLPVGTAAVLLGSYFAFAALPPVVAPPQNPITESKRVLGKMLFWDEQLSTSMTVSCGTCHSPARGGADGRTARNPGDDNVLNTPDDIIASPGIISSDASNDYDRHPVFALAPQITGRAANSMINSAYAPRLFWDGRANGQFVDPQNGEVVINTGGALESQAVQPLLDNVEMAHAGFDWADLSTKLARVKPLDLATNLPADISAVLTNGAGAAPDYPALFAAAFGDSQITARRIAFAMATYQRTLIADQTPWDRFQAGQTNALTPQQQQGLQAMNANNCTVCHAPPLFSDNTFRNIGLRPTTEDLGLQLTTGNVSDRGRFKVPSLRNVGLKSTFMHNGQFNTIGQVLGFYARAPGTQQFPDNRDPLMATIAFPPQVANTIGDFIGNGLLDPRVAAQTFPFDRPTLFTQRGGNQPTFIGGGRVGTGGFAPRIIANSPPMVGNLDFRIGLDGARPGAEARLGISSVAPINGQIVPEQFVTTITTRGTANGQGHGTYHWPLSPNIVSNGQVIFAQWFITDSGAAGGTSLSQVARIPVFCGSSGCPSVCPADVNNDGGVDGEDVSAFFDHWVTGSALGDFNQDGGTDGSDVGDFFRVWEGGC
jgi:cytochrome c peroxidase